ncbi:MAG: RtcB family protein [Promethearchaeota archaeon]
MKNRLEKIDDVHWRLDKTVRPQMRGDAMIIGSKEIIDRAETQAIEQLTNVACLPGVIEPVLAMPDIHWGYGLPMGAVGVFDAEDGIISAGCTGFDINCGIHMIRTNLSKKDIIPKIRDLVSTLFAKIPAGVGKGGKLRLDLNQLDDVLLNGAKWAVERDMGVEEDLHRMEENGRIEGADSSKVSHKAKKRGAPQIGSLGAGNHFLEVQTIDEIYQSNTAKTYGIDNKDQVVVMLHCGSRGLGHQVATDYLQIMGEAVHKYKIWLPDKQLVCAPTNSNEGQDYFAAMKAAVNFAFCNRLVITHWIRESFEQVFSQDWESLEMDTIYDVCHNIAKLEEHEVQRQKKSVYVHRKGATRSFGPGHPDVPEVYRNAGQPVLIAGSMGTASYILAGTEQAMKESFGSTCHGAGRRMSRKKAIKTFWGKDVRTKLERQGKVVRSTHPKILAEEAPDAYKDIDLVIDSVHRAGISLKVARMIPIGVMKG